MNKIERLVYDLVKSNPKIKLFFRNIYQAVFDLLPREKEYAINEIQLREGYFFGFHDLQPFSIKGDKILANKLFFDLRMPAENDYIDVGYFTFEDGKLFTFNKIGESNAWNYHKGCRLQWLDESRIIFNSTNDNQLCSKIVDVNTQEEQIVSFPIDSVDSNGAYATSFSYERLEMFMPGYGYNHKDSVAFIEEKYPNKTGLFLVDLKANDSRLLVDLGTLAEQSKDSENAINSSHYVTHSLFSPNNRYISFFHRWVGKETRKRYTRLMVFDLEEQHLFQVPTGYMVSHYVWNELSEIIAYCNFKGQDAHALFKIEDLNSSHLVAYPQLNSDGHQSFLGPTKFVTDTYGDRRRMSKLFLVDIDTDTAKLIASVFSPNKFQTKVPHKHIACDLHPRVSRDGRYVCFDTAKSGKRSLAVMSLQSND